MLTKNSFGHTVFSYFHKFFAVSQVNNKSLWHTYTQTFFSPVFPIFSCDVRINHCTSNMRQVLHKLQLEIVSSHFVYPPQNLWKNTRNIILQHRIQPLPRNSSI
uniref:Uncharacterized protein n=1 Tax=Opuntia streptacantha TaxID=393608 RepID=A0A7C9FN73_OPUST